MKGGSPIHTAKAVNAAHVSVEIAQEWGETLWTAPALADAEFQRRLEAVAVGWLFGVPAAITSRGPLRP